MEKLKKQVKGITLMVLVVTIIVLLILAGVAINLTLKDGGILSQARKAANEWDLATEREQTGLMKLANELERAKSGDTSGEGGGEDTPQDLSDLIRRIQILEEKANENESKIIEKIYPVGSIYITTELGSAEDVANKFGGTWESYGQGRTLVGVGTGTDENDTDRTFAINNKGGEYNHILSIQEMPAHDHLFGKTTLAFRRVNRK